MLPLPKVLRIFREWMRAPNDPGKRLEALSRFGNLIVPGYRFFWPDSDWWKNEPFTKYLTDFDEIDGYNTQRRWMMAQLLRLVATVPGDTAECGVYRGAGSYAILFANSKCNLPKIHHLFDSFEGLSSPVQQDGEYWSKGNLAASEEVVLHALHQFEAKVLYRGWIPQRFHEVADRRFSFVHVDVDLYEPTWDCVSFFYSRLEPGGVFLCDDYGMHVCPGATRACDEFLSNRAEKILALPDGGGFFIKGVSVGEEIYDSHATSA